MTIVGPGASPSLADARQHRLLRQRFLRMGHAEASTRTPAQEGRLATAAVSGDTVVTQMTIASTAASPSSEIAARSPSVGNQ